jgi:hypothetical protein
VSAQARIERAVQVLGALLLLAAVGLAVWLATRSPAAPQATVTAAAPTGDAFAKANRRPNPTRRIAGAAAAVPAPGPGEMRVCGRNEPRWPFEDGGAQRAPAVEQAAMQARALAAVEAFASRLQGSDHERATALVLRLQAERWRQPRDADECEDPACWAARAARDAAVARPFVDRLATLAAGSADGRVFSLAREQCFLHLSGQPSSAFCAALSARRWTAIEPDNAHAWLALAEEEPAAREEAMHRAALAPRWASHEREGWRYLDRVGVAGGLGDLATLRALMAVPGAVQVGQLQTVLAHCEPKALADGNRRQQCEQLADGLLRSPDLHGFSIGGVMAQRLKRPDGALRRDEARVLLELLSKLSPDEPVQQQLAEQCAADMPRALALRFAREGDVAIAREELRRSGLTLEEWRRKLPALDKAAAASAPASSLRR